VETTTTCAAVVLEDEELDPVEAPAEDAPAEAAPPAKELPPVDEPVPPVEPDDEDELAPVTC